MFRSISWPASAGLFSAVCLAAAVFGASPAAAQTEFRGGGFITDFSPQCAVEGWFGSVRASTRYRPSGLEGNGNTTRLSFFLDAGAVNYRTEGRFGTGFQQVDAFAIFASAYEQTTARPRIRLTPGSSINIGQGTTMVTLNGDIQNFNNVADCSARFRFYMHRR